MKPLRFRSALLIACVVALYGVAQALAQDAAPVATVDGEAISLEEIEGPVGANIAALKEEIYRLQRQRIEDIISERLLAKAAKQRGTTVDALTNAEVVAKVQPVTDAEVELFYQQNQGRLPVQQPDLRERIRTYLKNQKLIAQRVAFVNQLRAKAQVQVFLREPLPYRASTNIEGAPFKGAADAPVVIVKFEDFHCSFCKESQPTLEQLLSRYQNQVKIVHKDFPIEEIHPGVRQAHVAARCANVQGKFWPYHDTLYRNAPKTSPDDLNKYAAEAGLDAAAFELCLASGKFDAAVQANVEQGKQAGVGGTPAFLINGRLLGGAQSLDRFTQLIDEELARQR